MKLPLLSIRFSCSHSLAILLCLLAPCDLLRAADKVVSLPNVIFILADDLGYGDVSSFNPQSKVKTPHLDALAAQGVKFTDAHSPTAVCTPTRYALLTGRYSWRTKLARGVLLGFEPPLIAKDRLTLPQQLKGHGYHTAMIGKWHLGWDWPVTKEQLPLFYPKRGQSLDVTEAHRSAWAEFSKAQIPGGPIERGFDSYFGVCVPNLPPYGFIRDDRLTAPLAAMKNAGDVKDVGRTTTTGPAGAMVEGHRFDQIMPTLVKESVSYLASRAGKAEPFFLYLPLTSPHFPVVFLTDAQGILRFVDLNRKKDGTISKDYVRRLKADALIQAAKSATQSDKPIYEIPAATLPLDWKGFGKQELVEGVWQISELESDHHVAAPKIQLPAQDFIAEFEWRLPTAESAIFRLDVKTGHLGGLTWKPGKEGKPGLLVLAQQDYDREKGPAKIEWLAKAATKAPRDEWMKVRFELIGDKLRFQAGEHLLEAEKASFAQEKTTLAITVAGGAAQVRGLKIWKADTAISKP